MLSIFQTRAAAMGNHGKSLFSYGPHEILAILQFIYTSLSGAVSY